jgi:hypothetical protein
MATLGDKPHTYRALKALDKPHASNTYTCECRTTLSGSGNKSPNGAQRRGPSILAMSTSDAVAAIRTASLCAATTRDGERGEVTTDTCTHGASQTHSSTRIREASGCPATRPFHHGNRCAASGFCAWGIQPQPGNGTVQYHRVPAHRTPSDVVAGLGVHFFPRNRSVDSDCSPSANLGRA